MELVERLVDGVARRDHQPDDPWGLELLHEIRERVRAGGPLRYDRVDHGLRPSVAHHVVSSLDQPYRHVRAHFSEPDHSQFHRSPPTPT